MDGDGGGKYDGLTRQQLVALLEKRDRARKLGLVWERDEIEPDGHAAEADFVAATPVPGLHERAAPWRNLVIEGDNWDALRWLRMTWAGRVKCILVDPPYNTGNKDWVYNDHYRSAEDRWRHSTWLEFLHRRFTLARDLLTEDGVMLVCINDENRAKLELLLDEVMPGMRVGSLVWRIRQGSNADQQAFLSRDHEHILIYAKLGFRFGGTEKSYEMYSNPNNDVLGDWRKDNLTLGFNYRERPNLYYPLQDPKTGIFYTCNPERVWVYASRTRSSTSRTKFMEDWIAEDRVIFPECQRTITFATKEDLLTAIRAGNVPRSGRTPLLREELPNIDFWINKQIGFGMPSFKRYKKDLRNSTQPLSTWINSRSDSIEAQINGLVSGTNEEGSKSIADLFGEKAFNYAKPLSLFRGLLEQATSPGDTILDFFAGSATTAQAAMALNATDAGARRFIMVSSTEATADAPDRNLCRDVTAGRIRRLNASDNPAYAALSAEFAYLRCRTLAFEDLDYDLQPAEAWAALEAMHGLPLTQYDPAPWSLHEGSGTALIYVDTFEPGLLPVLKRLSDARTPAFVYAWAPGQIREVAAGLDVEVHGVRDTLVARFRQ